MKAHCFKRRHLGFVSGARLLGVVLLALTMPGARAQFAANNQTNVIDGTAVVYGTTYYVGYPYWGNTLIVTNAGSLASSAGQLGASAGSSNNLAHITGAGSVWMNTGLVYVGDWGSDNLLAITDGGKVFNTSGTISYRGIRGNAARVEGAGSVWSNSAGFVLGRTGTNNHLVIADGGKVYGGDFSYLGQASYSFARIAGTGSELLVNLLGPNRRLYVGGGTGNEVDVESGGRVDCGACALFYATSSTQNTFRISGPNSALDCTGLTVADKGFGNRLVVTNGGRVRTGNGTLGGLGAVSNSVLVTGTASVWTNSGVLTVGGSSSIGNTLVIADGGAVFGRDYSYLGSGQTGGSSGNDVLITGAGSRLYITPAGSNRRLFIGWSGGGNRVTLRDGGLLDNGECVVGYGAAGTHGTVSVEGPGSLWLNSAALTVGREGAGNRLVITRGGAVENTTAVIGSLANDNTVVIHGSGSLWRVNGALTVGGAGRTGNALFTGEGGRVTVSGNVIVNAGNAVTNNVAGYSGGLDMTAGTATFTLNGTMAVNFAGDPLVKGLYWGLRRAGNHTNALQQLINAGSLTLDDSGLSPFLQGRAGLHYDTTNSYVGLVVTRVPLPSERSTLVLIR